MKRYSAKQMIEQYGNADAAINAALDILRKEMRQHGAAMSSPAAVRDYLRLDWMLVPSMGDTTTVTMHKRHGATLFRAFGAVSAVANQTKVPGTPEPGFVLCAAGEPAATDGEPRQVALPGLLDP